MNNKIVKPSFVVLLMLVYGCGGLTQNGSNKYEQRVLATLQSVKDLESSVMRPKVGVDFAEHLKSSIIFAPEVAAAASEVDASLASVVSARSQTKPQLSGSALAGMYKNDTARPDASSGASLNLRVSQLVYDGGGVFGAISEAELETELAREKLRIAVNEAASDAAETWITLWGAQREVADLLELETELAPRIEQVKRMSDMGVIDRSTSDMILERSIDLAIRRQDAKSQLVMASSEFEQHFGLKPWALELPPEPAPVKVLKPENNIPKVRVAALGVLLARGKVSIAESKFAPRITLEAASSSPIDIQDKPNAQFGLNFTYYFYDGGKRKADIARAEADVERSTKLLILARSEASVIQSEFQARLDNLQENIELQSAKILSIEKQLKTAEAQIQTGQADLTKILQMKIEHYEIRARLRDARAKLLILKYKINSLFGNFEYPENGDKG